MKFTQEIKDKWLEALKSGKYVQGVGELHNKQNNTYCCYGVLAVVIGQNDLSTPITGQSYDMITENCGPLIADNLYSTNDRLSFEDTPDYSNVIPLIEALEVQD